MSTIARSREACCAARSRCGGGGRARHRCPTVAKTGIRACIRCRRRTGSRRRPRPVARLDIPEHELRDEVQGRQLFILEDIAADDRRPERVESLLHLRPVVEGVTGDHADIIGGADEQGSGDGDEFGVRADVLPGIVDEGAESFLAVARLHFRPVEHRLPHFEGGAGPQDLALEGIEVGALLQSFENPGGPADDVPRQEKMRPGLVERPVGLVHLDEVGFELPHEFGGGIPGLQLGELDLRVIVVVTAALEEGLDDGEGEIRSSLFCGIRNANCSRAS